MDLSSKTDAESRLFILHFSHFTFLVEVIAQFS